MLEDDTFDKGSEQHPDEIGVHAPLLASFVRPRGRMSLGTLCVCEVYSKSIRARASYLAADEKALALHDIDPHDSIEVLYTPAMRRIRHGILQMDPPARSRFAPVPLMSCNRSSQVCDAFCSWTNELRVLLTELGPYLVHGSGRSLLTASDS
jgi:hypothetical protein